jgi:hypothetical protein
MALFVLHLDHILKHLHARSPNMATSTSLLAYIISVILTQPVSFLSEDLTSRQTWLNDPQPPTTIHPRVIIHSDSAVIAFAITVESPRCHLNGSDSVVVV